MPGMFTDFGTKLKDFAGSDMFPVALGAGAQALVADDPNSWQYQMGKTAVGLQQSNIAAKARMRQAEERKALIKLLSGEGFTEKGVPGITSFNVGSSPQGGNKITIDGDQLFNKGMGGATRPQSSSSPPPTGQEEANRPSAIQGSQPVMPGSQPVPQPQQMMDMSKLLPLYLAQAGRSSGGTGQSLAGLTPEQMTAISRDDLMGGELMNRSISDIFSNMQKQSSAAYSDRLPQARAGADPSIAAKNDALAKKYAEETKYISRDFNVKRSLANLEGLKYNLKVKRDEALNNKDYAQADKIEQELADLERKEATQKAMMESGINLEDANAGAVMAAGGGAGDISLAHQRRTKARETAAKNRSILLTEGKDDEGNASMALIANEQAPDGTPSYVAWSTKGNNGWKEIPLPIIDGRQMTMKDAKLKAQEKGVSLDVFLDNYSEYLRSRGEM